MAARRRGVPTTRSVVFSPARLIVGQATVLWEMLAELNSSSLQGYGIVSPQLAAYIDPVGESLTQQMREISRLFSRRYS